MMEPYFIHLLACSECRTPVMVVNTDEVYFKREERDFEDGKPCRDCGKGTMRYVGRVEVKP